MSGESTTWGHFQNPSSAKYILVVVDYVSKWVEALPCQAVDSNNAKRMFSKTIYPCFGVPQMVISNRGPHFIDRKF
jgi:hypothetical protein